MTSPLKVVILGGGTAGWMCATALAGARGPTGEPLCQIHLVESSDIGIVGVGEATLPHIKEFNDSAGIDEAEFMRKTQASFKIGIEFRDWGKAGNSYVHPFGTFGQPMAGVEFQNYWVRAQQAGFEPGSVEAYSYAVTACRHMRFDFPSEDKKSVKSTFSYAYHFDASLYSAFLRELCLKRGVTRTDGKVVDVVLNPDNGFVTSLTMESGESIAGDLFIDCSGFRGVLIEQALKTGWQSWADWLPCDRAWAVPCARSDDFTPFTRSTALEAGWQWRIPLQHRTGNGYVYSSRFISDDAAAARLMGNLDGAAEAEPRQIRFEAGRRKSSWVKNVVCTGLSSGFLEPLESTSIYLVQIAATLLLQLFPNRDMEPRLAREFNRLIDIEYERVRDFLILHYHANSRDDAELWRYTRAMTVPDSLTHKMELFRRRAHIVKYKDGLFSPPSWLAVYLGQDVAPEGYDRMADNLSDAQVQEKLTEIRTRILASVEAMPTHADFVRDYCYLPPAKSAAMAGAAS